MASHYSVKNKPKKILRQTLNSTFSSAIISHCDLYYSFYRKAKRKHPKATIKEFRLSSQPMTLTMR